MLEFRRMLWCVLVVLCAACAQTPHVAFAPLEFNTATVGVPENRVPEALYRPEGNGPFPAMVVLHGCDGINSNDRNWARRLVNWGYVALLVDSFGPRNIKSVCNHGRDVPAELRAQDALAAADYLRTLPYVRADRIGIIGFSHGGWTVLKDVLASDAGVTITQPFAAAVAFYPACERPRSPLLTDTLILIGDADDWTPVTRCERWRDWVDKGAHSVELIVYHGAVHGFDTRRPVHRFAGHLVGSDPVAAEDAIARTKGFLQRHLDSP